MKHIVEAQQFSREWLEREFFPLTERMEAVFKGGGSSILPGEKMITLFYEPSTRTRASFEMAMDYLGGRVVFSTENARQFSSAKKGETLEDTIRVLNRYHPDVIVLRYDQEGGAKEAARVSDAAVINAGDGSGQHPTQALLDIFTIHKRLGSIDGISVAMVGDLLNGRTVRSLCYLLAKFKDVRVYFVSPEQIRMKEDIKEYLQRKGVFFEEHFCLTEVINGVDVVYQTRVQDERGAVVDVSDFIIDIEMASSMKRDAVIMHPLPRRVEIAPEVDQDRRAVYLTDQIDSGIITRMAELVMLLS